MRGLEGKRVVVTGGTSGIGEATCRRFRDEGASVVSIAADDGEDNIVCDVADAAQVERAFEQIGAVDVLVANAGISIRSPFLDIREEDWRRVLDVNLTGVFHCAQQAARRMDDGVILMTASTNGLTGHESYADYNASKAGVILLARTMALELAPQIPLGRHADPVEIAALFAFLASDDAAYITGAAIAIDGGETA